MVVEISYKNVHVFLISLFTVCILLSLTGLIASSIDANFVIKYSIFGLIITIVSWDIIYNHYYKNTKNIWILLVILVLTLLFNINFPSSWLIIYVMFGFLYAILLKLYKLI